MRRLAEGELSAPAWQAAGAGAGTIVGIYALRLSLLAADAAPVLPRQAGRSFT